MKIRVLYQNYKTIVLYIIFGILTTLVNIIGYWFVAHILNWSVMKSTVFAWVASVLFAYFTNRKWVFESRVTNRTAIFKEIYSFFICRVATGIFDWGCMFIFVEKLNFNDIIVKILVNFSVIIINYVASKFFIFKDNINQFNVEK